MCMCVCIINLPYVKGIEPPDLFKEKDGIQMLQALEIQENHPVSLYFNQIHIHVHVSLKLHIHK